MRRARADAAPRRDGGDGGCLLGADRFVGGGRADGGRRGALPRPPRPFTLGVV